MQKNHERSEMEIKGNRGGDITGTKERRGGAGGPGKAGGGGTKGDWGEVVRVQYQRERGEGLPVTQEEVVTQARL